MSLDPKTFRPEDMAALVADVVLRLIEDDDHNEDVSQTARALALALRDGERQGLADRGNQYWYWVAAIESTLACSVDGSESAHHRRDAFRALRMARLHEPSGSLLPVSSWMNVGFEEFWKVSLAAQALAVIMLRARRTMPADAHADLSHIASVATSHGASRLLTAARRVAAILNVDLSVMPEPRATPDGALGVHPAELASRMIATGRPDLCEPTLRRSVLAEVEEQCGAGNSAARRAADLLEAVAMADVWPFMFGGPTSGWGAVRDELLFDSLFYRVAAIGAGRRSGETSWVEVPDLVQGMDTLWLRELRPDLSLVAGVSCTTGGGWRSELMHLGQGERDILRRMAAGDVKALEVADFERIGELLLEPLLGTYTDPHLLTAILSPKLRCVPLEALRPGGNELVSDTLVSVVPGLVSLATREAKRLELGDRLRVLGLFQPSLRGANAEIELLRGLVRQGKADGVGFTGPVKLKRALQDEPCDMLTVATHGTIRSGVPVLETPVGPLGLPELLAWSFPPIVNLGACRSAETTDAAVPLDWVTVALRRGARSVVAARWSVPDRSTARITSQFYTNLAERRYEHGAPAFRDAMLKERGRRAHPWFWAGLGLFGDEMAGSRWDQDR